MDKKIILANGREFYGKVFGYNKDIVSEIVFNTSMAGYQEIISDNSYASQSLVMTFPLMGVYGINPKDYESVEPKLDAIIVHQEVEDYDHYEGTKSLSDYLNYYKVVGIGGINTRELVRIIREEGSMPCLICDVDTPVSVGLTQIQKTPLSRNQVEEVSTKKPYKIEGRGYKLAVIDFGIKLNILRELSKRDFDITVLPYNATLNDIKATEAEGIFLSNGPGDPRDLVEVIENLKELQKHYPIFGICLGHQLIALANDCEIEKLKFGHRGGNHPVKNLKTGKVEITSQNHSYAVVDYDTMKIEVTHLNLLDNTIEGLRVKNKPIFSVQYHPESAPGPEDSSYLFDDFLKIIDDISEKRS